MLKVRWVPNRSILLLMQPYQLLVYDIDSKAVLSRADLPQRYSPFVRWLGVEGSGACLGTADDGGCNTFFCEHEVRPPPPTIHASRHPARAHHPLSVRRCHVPAACWPRACVMHAVLVQGGFLSVWHDASGSLNYTLFAFHRLTPHFRSESLGLQANLVALVPSLPRFSFDGSPSDTPLLTSPRMMWASAVMSNGQIWRWRVQLPFSQSSLNGARMHSSSSSGAQFMLWPVSWSAG